ncbi:hypothetical protein GGF31_003375 [Allomyces arbusculus]|nr:hypothetical protein GGF31_003375 [Allomyces arbusculus]
MDQLPAWRTKPPAAARGGPAASPRSLTLLILLALLVLVLLALRNPAPETRLDPEAAAAAAAIRDAVEDREPRAAAGLAFEFDAYDDDAADQGAAVAAAAAAAGQVGLDKAKAAAAVAAGDAASDAKQRAKLTGDDGEDGAEGDDNEEEDDDDDPLPTAALSTDRILRPLAREPGNLTPLATKQSPRTPALTRKLGLLALVVTKSVRKTVAPLITKFRAEGLDVVLFHTDPPGDDPTPAWVDAVGPAYHECTAIRAAGQGKYWFAKRFLTPDVVQLYDFLFLWDAHVALPHAEWSPSQFTALLKRFHVHIAQPALLRSDSDQITLGHVHAGSPIGRYTTRIDMAVPVISRAAWQGCVWATLPHDGVSFAGANDAWYPVCATLGYCRTAVVDAMAVHHRAPKLDADAAAAADKERTALASRLSGMCALSGATDPWRVRPRAKKRLCAYLATHPVDAADVDARARTLGGMTLATADSGECPGWRSVANVPWWGVGTAPESEVVKKPAPAAAAPPAKEKEDVPVAASPDQVVVPKGKGELPNPVELSGDGALRAKHPVPKLKAKIREDESEAEEVKAAPPKDQAAADLSALAAAIVAASKKHAAAADPALSRPDTGRAHIIKPKNDVAALAAALAAAGTGGGDTAAAAVVKAENDETDESAVKLAAHAKASADLAKIAQAKADAAVAQANALQAAAVARKAAQRVEVAAKREEQQVDDMEDGKADAVVARKAVQRVKAAQGEERQEEVPAVDDSASEAES